MTTFFKTPLGNMTESVEEMARTWSKLADAISDVGWVHHGVDDRGGWMTFWNPTNPPVSPESGLMRFHVSYALSLYSRIYGKDFEE